jgi:hypothetical protein
MQKALDIISEKNLRTASAVEALKLDKDVRNSLNRLSCLFWLDTLENGLALISYHSELVAKKDKKQERFLTNFVISQIRQKNQEEGSDFSTILINIDELLIFFPGSGIIEKILELRRFFEGKKLIIIISGFSESLMMSPLQLSLIPSGEMLAKQEQKVEEFIKLQKMLNTKFFNFVEKIIDPECINPETIIKPKEALDSFCTQNMFNIEKFLFCFGLYTFIADINKARILPSTNATAIIVAPEEFHTTIGRIMGVPKTIFTLGLYNLKVKNVAVKCCYKTFDFISQLSFLENKNQVFDDCAA